jgi:hypothetical protein
MELLLTEKQIKNINENVNPLHKRWTYERYALKDYLIKYGQTMISKENGKEYKVILDNFISNLLGINFCVCIQWDSVTKTSGDIIYIRAYDKFAFKP